MSLDIPGTQKEKTKNNTPEFRELSEFCHNTFHTRTQTKRGLPGAQELKFSVETEGKEMSDLMPERPPTHGTHPWARERPQPKA